MDSRAWDDRYAAADLVWSREPNRFVAELAGPLRPGAAADIAAGEGRNAIWLAQQGWTVTATDYSTVAVERMRERAEAVLGPEALRLTALVADATAPTPGGPAAYDLVLFSYLQLPADQMRAALRAGLEAARPVGRLLLVGHAGRNLEHGWGGPSDPAVLHDPDEVIAMLAGGPAMHVELAEIRERPVETDDGLRQALDTVVLVTRS